MQTLYIVYLYNSGGKGWLRLSDRPSHWSQIAYVSDNLKSCEEFMENWCGESDQLHITMELSGPKMGEYVGYISGHHDYGAVFRATIQSTDVTHLVFNSSPLRFRSLPLTP